MAIKDSCESRLSRADEAVTALSHHVYATLSHQEKYSSQLANVLTCAIGSSSLIFTEAN